MAPHYNITITLNPTDSSSVSNIEVTLTDAEGTEQTGTTNASGVVQFSMVAAGNATVDIEGLTSIGKITVSSSSRTFMLDCC